MSAATTSRAVPRTPSLFPTRRSFGWLSLAGLVLVVYASWTPFDFQPLSFEEARDQFGEVLGGPLRIASRADWVANVLLMVPAGFCLMAALGLDRPRGGALGDAVLALPVCLAASVIVEFGQVFLPNRCSALSDIVAQGIGAVFGSFLWVGVGQQASEWLRRFWTPREGVGLSARLLPIYIVLLLAVHLVPLDVTVSPTELYRKFTSGRVNLIPFVMTEADPYAFVQKILITTLYFFVLGLLLPGLPGALWRDRRRVGPVLLRALALAGCLLGLKVLIVSRGFDINDVLVAGLAALAGWFVALHCRDLWGRDEAWLALRAGLFVLWLALVTFVTWQPFDFDMALAEYRVGGLTLLPFVDHWQGSELLALENVVQKAVLYLPLGVLLTTWQGVPSRLTWVPTFLVAAVIALVLEAGQVILISRSPSVSDVYVQTAGAVLGSIITRRMCAKSGRLAAEASLAEKGGPRTRLGEIV
jgi:VanZ family protein